jgi:hypothetical protein
LPHSLVIEPPKYGMFSYRVGHHQYWQVGLDCRLCNNYEKSRTTLHVPYMFYNILACPKRDSDIICMVLSTWYDTHDNHFLLCVEKGRATSNPLLWVNPNSTKGTPNVFMGCCRRMVIESADGNQMTPNLHTWCTIG